MFWPITLKQLNSLILIGKFRCLYGLEVTYQTAVRQAPGEIPDSGKYFMLAF